jgi:S1-C subfamily serine protease
VPEELPALKGKYTGQLNYEGNVVQSCIHCHMVGEAQRQLARQSGTPLPDRAMYPYPHPKQFGLIPDPAEAATVLRVERGSVAESGGFQAGDEIIALGGQPIISIADVQWVLHHAPDSGVLTGRVRRAGRDADVSLTLGPGWRRQGDISWRVSSWALRRIALGGLSLEEATPEERRRARVTDEQLALRVKGVGQYGPHAAARDAGFQKDDVIVAFDGRRERMSEGQLFEYVLNNRRAGDKAPVVVVRGTQRRELTMPIQD